MFGVCFALLAKLRGARGGGGARSWSQALGISSWKGFGVSCFSGLGVSDVSGALGPALPRGNRRGSASPLGTTPASATLTEEGNPRQGGA